MADIRTLLVGLLTKWNMEHYISIRIRIVMGFLMVMYYLMLGASCVLVPGSNVLRAMDAVCDMLLVYVMGAMQAAPFKNQILLIWAVLLVSFHSTANTMSKYDTYFELKNMLKLWAAALLNVKHGSKSLRAPFWLFWGILVVKSLYRIRARKLASKSLWHSRSSELVREYMVAVDHDLSNFNPDTLEGCKFLVYGESKKNIKKGLSPSTYDLRSVVSLDNIWLHDGSPLQRRRDTDWPKNTIKDLTLAFALSRLLRFRMEGGRLNEDTISITKEIICSRIIHGDDDADNVLAAILLLDLSFLGQHIHTGYPMVFCQGLRSLYFPALDCAVQLTCLVWLLVPSGPRNKADALIHFVAIFMMLGMETVEVLRYMSSNWTMLLLVCKYVNCRNDKRMEHVFGRLISSVPAIFQQELTVSFSSRYDFLESANYSKGELMLGTSLSGQLIGLTGQFSSWTCFKTVMVAVFQALARYMDEEGSRLPRHCLSLPRVSVRAQRYWSACPELRSCSHIILVWHIATSLCRVKLEQDRGIFAVNLSRATTVANCLSRHCLHLLISNPNLLLENVFASKKLLLDTIQHAHDILRCCKSPQSRYNELIASSQEVAVPAGSGQDFKLTGNILIQGAMLGKELIESEDEEGRWEILAEVWADILIQIAPSSKAEAHGKTLQFGIELVTLVWALLCHCGIERSELWPEER